MQPSYGISRRNILQWAAGATLSAVAPSTGLARGGGKVVVELFTSQGCSSCPPADAFLQVLSKMKGVVALTYNVDYWNYLGWRDTLSLPEFSQRQYDYAKSRGDMDVYTPQMIVDGSSHYVGSNKAVVLKAIERALNAQSSRIAMSMTASASDIKVEIESGPQVKDATLWLMPVNPAIAVKIGKGENSGRDIVYTNVVRKLAPAGMWHGEAMKITLPWNGIMTEESKACVALLQQGKTGPILGSAHWGEIGA